MNGQTPLQQGDLDGLCGLYALLNAVSGADPTLRHVTRKAMFRDAMRWLHREGHMPGVLYNGLDIRLIVALFHAVIRSRRKGLSLKRPFWSRRPADMDSFCSKLNELAGTPGQAVIIGIAGKTWSHWTVLDEADRSWIKFRDSAHIDWLRRRSCGLPGDGAAYSINPAEVMLIKNSAYKHSTSPSLTNNTF